MEFGGIRRARRGVPRRGPRSVAIRRPRRRRRRTRPSAEALGVELKFYDQKLIAGALVTNTDGSGGEHDPSATVLLNTVVQGDGESNRDGRQIMMKNIFVTGVINIPSQANQSATDNAALIFIALVLDTQTNGATITSEQVYLNPGVNALTGCSLVRNLQFTKRFQVLATKKFTMQNPNIAFSGTTDQMEQNGLTRAFIMSRKLGIIVNYSDTAETVANIVDNSLHILAWTTSATLVPTISYTSRLRFVG